MKCIVTAGPTFEPLDEVRRLTNFSTGRLGCEFAQFLANAGHSVTLLLGQQATHQPPPGVTLQRFTTTANLRENLQKLAGPAVNAVFHAAAVSDFAPGKVFVREPGGALRELHEGKVSSRHPGLLLELLPTPKIIKELRTFFPHACLVGWKYEVDGDRSSTVEKAVHQISECATDACVANGSAYGRGFGIVTADKPLVHTATMQDLFQKLELLIREHGKDSVPPATCTLDH